MNLTLITDRTQEDVNRWLYMLAKGYSSMTAEEKEEWDSATMKGAYNYTDLNRVGTALNYLRDMLIDASYLKSNVFTAKTDWTILNIPTVTQINAYLSYVNIIREALAQFPDTPPVPTFTDSLDYTMANDIEHILLDVDILINNMLAEKLYLGELFLGEF